MIGYVGASGLPTGAHLHYELIVNGTKVDPMRVRLPNGKVLKGNDLRRLQEGTRAHRPAAQEDDRQLAEGRPASSLTADDSGLQLNSAPTDRHGARGPERRPNGVQTSPIFHVFA